MWQQQRTRYACFQGEKKNTIRDSSLNKLVILAARSGSLWFNKQLIRNWHSLSSEWHLHENVHTAGSQVRGQSLAELYPENTADTKPQMISSNKISAKYSG